MAAKTPPAAPRPAATLVLMRDGAAGRAPQVLMVERHAAADFAAGAYVFPGGGVEESDAGGAVERLSPALAPAQAGAALSDLPSGLEALGYYVAAIRETFEESGILLARPADRASGPGDAGNRERMAVARERINRGDLAFLEWIASQGWVLSTERLVYFAHWVTPEAAPKRFDTRFFLAPAPPGMDAAHDTREVVSHRWLTAAEALEGAAAGRIFMIEPTVVNLERLAAYGTSEAALQDLRGQAVPRIMPKMIFDAQGRRVIILPWDPEYETA
jgi:8-oxo-dGTP pyrophosphatase MutT (NUDIX family)